MIVGLLGDISAATFYPEEYTIFTHMISDLGTPDLNPGGFMVFNIAVIVSGILGVPFSMYIGRLFQTKYGPNKWIYVAKYANVVAYLALSFIGLSLALSVNKQTFFFLLHGIFADVCFLGTATYCIIYSYFIQDKNLVFPRYFAFISFLAGITQLIFIVSWQPLIEWISHVSIVFWIILMGVYTTYKNY